MGIGYQVIESVIVVAQLLLLCLHENVFRLALVGQADGFDRRLLLACNSTQGQQRYGQYYNMSFHRYGCQ